MLKAIIRLEGFGLMGTLEKIGMEKVEAILILEILFTQ